MHINCSSSGFKLALVHHLDMPVMSQAGISVSPGTIVKIGVSPQIIEIEPSALTRFSPEARDCYDVSDRIDLQHLPQEEFRYAMSNCLFEALVQETEKNCSCTPNSVGFNVTTESCHGKKLTCKEYIFCK